MVGGHGLQSRTRDVQEQIEIRVGLGSVRFGKLCAASDDANRWFHDRQAAGGSGDRPDACAGGQRRGSKGCF